MFYQIVGARVETVLKLVQLLPLQLLVQKKTVFAKKHYESHLDNYWVQQNLLKNH